jgi:hypothetical protein
MSKKFLPLRNKYLPLVLVAFMVLTVLSGMSKPIEGAMPPPDGGFHRVYRTDYPPVIDGTVKVGDTWPAISFIGHTYIAGGNDVGDIITTDVYMLMDNVIDGEYPYDKNTPTPGYSADYETGYYLYIGVKAVDGYKIADDGNWLVIDWDQDGWIDFTDNNGNSANKGQGGYSTEYAWTEDGVEWKIPYMDQVFGQCCSRANILIHIEIVLPCSGGETETTTFPGRGGSGPFMSTTICVFELLEPDPPTPNGPGLRTIGFWKHQFNTALGHKNGHNHIDYATLAYYLWLINNNPDYQSMIPDYDDMNLDDALGLLELKGKHTMYEKAVQQLLATWLNYVSGSEVADLDNDGTFETNLLDVIMDTEAALLDGDPANDEQYKDLCDAVNNSGPE